MNYADQRFYSSIYGRFNTPDKYKASGGASDPGSWNRYTYVGNDPVNFVDAAGNEKSTVEDPPDVYLGSSDWCTGDLSGTPDPSCSTYEAQSTEAPRMSGPCPSGFIAFNGGCFLHPRTRTGENWAMFLGVLNNTINNIIGNDSDCLNFLESNATSATGRAQAYQTIGNAKDIFSIADDMRLQSHPDRWWYLRGVSNTSSPTGQPMINFNTFANESRYAQREDIIHELAHFLVAIPSEGGAITSDTNNKVIDTKCAKTLNAQ